MSQSLRHSPLHSSISTKEECDEERVAEVMRKIAYVAACIDLYRWRNVIDQVLRELEAENRASKSASVARTADKAEDRRCYGKRFSAYTGPRRLDPQAA
ncbi:MAG: hypothetical protein WAN43_09125 [Rhodomicrobium sp.]|jgi:hypothetical protein